MATFQDGDRVRHKRSGRLGKVLGTDWHGAVVINSPETYKVKYENGGEEILLSPTELEKVSDARQQADPECKTIKRL
jgi:hypothetical protein